MKWLQLDCNFPEDPRIEMLAGEWGGETAAAFWTLLLAYVGRYGIPGCRVRIEENGVYSPKHIASKLSSKPMVTLRRVERAAQVGLIDRESWEQHREIYIPKMLKRVDEYTRKVRTKSGETPEPTHAISQSQLQLQSQSDKEKAALLRRLTEGFEELWAQYPARTGRKDAEKHFKASVKTDENLAEIRQALPNYLRHLSCNSWKRPQSGKTWFYNWRDWVNWSEPEVPKLKDIDTRRLIDPHPAHHCGYCNTPHAWECENFTAPVSCGSPHESACPIFAKRFAR